MNLDEHIEKDRTDDMKEKALRYLTELSLDDRCEILGNFCLGCGGMIPHCVCFNDGDDHERD